MCCLPCFYKTKEISAFEHIARQQFKRDPSSHANVEFDDRGWKLSSHCTALEEPAFHWLSRSHACRAFCV